MGRLPTGRTSKVVRVPIDFNLDLALRMYYDVMPTLLHYARVGEKTTSPRYYAVRQIVDETQIQDML